MKFILLTAILATSALAALGIVIALYRHKKSSMGEVSLIGEVCQVNSSLTPEGTVLVHGELWRARSADEVSIIAPAQVRVVEARDHLLMVTLLNE